MTALLNALIALFAALFKVTSDRAGKAVIASESPPVPLPATTWSKQLREFLRGKEGGIR
jgi:hypothetical protein